MKLFADTFAWLSDGANWSGPEGLWHLLVQQLLLTFTALGIAMVIALPVALWLGHLGRAGFLAINVADATSLRAATRFLDFSAQSYADLAESTDLAEQVIDGKSKIDLSSFSLKRFKDLIL